jgi:hypothetical protein
MQKFEIHYVHWMRGHRQILPKGFRFDRSEWFLEFPISLQMDILRINFKKAQLVKLFRLKLSKSNKNLLNSNFKKNIKHIETANKYNKQ